MADPQSVKPERAQPHDHAVRKENHDFEALTLDKDTIKDLNAADEHNVKGGMPAPSTIQRC